MGMVLIYSNGDKVGNLTYIKEHSYTNKVRRCYFKCFCGKVKFLRLADVKREKIISCGCIRAEAIRTHGNAGAKVSPEYSSYDSMKQRCLNPNHPQYKYWGGRGITICQRWLDGFENFLSDMGKRPSMRHTLDRFPNKNGNYEPGNCRWATDLEQARNTRRNNNITYNGVTKTITEWSDETGISLPTLRRRMKLYPIEYLFHNGYIMGDLKHKLNNTKKMIHHKDCIIYKNDNHSYTWNHHEYPSLYLAKKAIDLALKKLANSISK